MARNINQAGILLSIESKIEHYSITTNKLLDEAVDVLVSIDKKIANNSQQIFADKVVGLLTEISNKLDKQASGGISLDKNSGKEVAVALGGITSLVKELGGVDANTVDKVMTSIVRGVTKIQLVAKDFNKDMKGFNKNLLGLGVAIIGFSVAMALAGPLLVTAIPAIIALSGTIFLLGKTFENVDTKKMKEGSDALKSLGVGILAMGLGFMVFNVVKPESVLLGIGALVGVAGVLLLLDKFSSGKNIRETSLALITTGLAIGAIGIGMAIFQKMDISFETIMMSTLAVGLVGITMALAGKFSGEILKGSAVMILAGIPLAIIGFSLGMFAKSMASVSASGMGPWEFLGYVAATVTSIGAIMGVAGLAAPFILAGAASMIVAGAALIVLTKGLAAFATANFGEEESKNLTFALAGIRAAFTGTEGKSDGFFSSVGSAFAGVMDAGAMAASAAGFIAAGFALGQLSKGLTKFQEVNWDNEDTVKLTTMLTGISGAFAIAGGGEVKDAGGILGVIGIKTNDTEEGIRSVMDAGDALIGIVEGLIAFQGLIDQNVDFDVLGSSITKTVGFVQQAFASIGSEDKVESGGFFSSLLGIDSTATEEGIRSVMDAGDALTGIAEGLIGFQKLIDSNVDFEVLGSAISTTVGFVQSAFAAIGGEEKVESGGFFSSLFGVDSTKSEEGIRSVMDAGDALTGIAEGLIAFQKLAESDIDPVKLAESITTIVGLVSQAFAAIGGGERVESGGFFSQLFNVDSNATEEGIRAVSGAGEQLSEIATGLKAFTEIVEPESVAKSIEMLLGNTLAIFDVSKDENIESKTKYFGQFSEYFVNIAEKHKELGKTAKSFKSIAESVGEFKTSLNGMDLEKLDCIV